jgi:hypothetical protein
MHRGRPGAPANASPRLPALVAGEQGAELEPVGVLDGAQLGEVSVVSELAQLLSEGEIDGAVGHVRGP